MSQLNLNDLISAALVVGAVLSGLGLTAQTKDKEFDEHLEVSDLAGMMKVRAEPDNSSGTAPPGELEA